MLAKEDEVDVEVRKVDQDKINEFGRLSHRLTELRDEIAAINKNLTSYEDAEEEVMLVEDEDEALKLTFGDCFLDVEGDDVEAEIQRLTEVANSQKEVFESEMEKIAERQSELKADLYGRFGKTINLEE
jgi:chaperonin cofactor prefoldin